MYGPGDELHVARALALNGGVTMLDMHGYVEVWKKDDGTRVSTADVEINRYCIEYIQAFSGGRARILGEEESADPVLVSDDGTEELWTVDPVDGTHEYLDPSVPYDRRTSCTAIARIVDGVVDKAAVFEPFRGNLFLADRQTSRATFEGPHVPLGGRPLVAADGPVAKVAFGPDMPYDFSHWDGADPDARFFEEIMARPPEGAGSCVHQAMQVARGENGFALFPGKTIHDVAPSLLIAELAGAVVSDLEGRPVDLFNIHGVIYAVNQAIHERVVHELAQRR
jgi:fructose-1,6-bisphosphatase/inositol monophosphatase family enzyme